MREEEKESETNDDNLLWLLKTVDHLFGDLAVFNSDEIVTDDSEELAFISEGSAVIKLRKKIEESHVVDQLKCVNEANDIEEENKSTLLREIVQELKDQLPQTYDKAWNHPDEKLKML